MAEDLFILKNSLRHSIYTFYYLCSFDSNHRQSHDIDEIKKEVDLWNEIIDGYVDRDIDWMEICLLYFWFGIINLK